MFLNGSTIAVVGAGASGALVAAQLLRQSPLPLRVLLYEPRDFLGLGLAYGTQDIAHSLNVPAGRMSALPDQPSHFIDWLNTPSNCASLLRGGRFVESDFVPRPIYGRYLSFVVEEAMAMGRIQGARLEHRRERVRDFIPFQGGGTIVTESADTEDVAHVVLALGNLPPRNPLARSHEFFSSPRYVPWVWKDGVLDEIGTSEDLLIVGSGLTALDVVATLARNGHRGKITITSRNGRLPQPHARQPLQPGLPADDFRSTSCRRWFRHFREMLDRAVNQGVDWRVVIDSLRPRTQEIWQTLDVEERQRFLRHVRSLWECHRHRAPLAVWEVLDRQIKAGQIRFVPGRIQDFHEKNRSVTVELRPKGKSENIPLKVQRVLNCIGPESNFRNHLNDPLIVNLMARGILHPDPLYLGLEATPDGKIIGEDGAEVPQISTLGPPLRGVLWETTAMPEIRRQAHDLASRLLANIATPSWSI